MFIFKNAWISITRNKGRNILIGAIILVIACACTITLAINDTASDLIDSYSNSHQKELTLSFDRKQMMKDFDTQGEEGREQAKEKFENIASYTVDDVKTFAENSHIESYYYAYSFSLNGNSIEKAEIETATQSGGFGGRPNGKGQNKNSLDFTLNGYSSIESMSEFINGTYTMSEITDNAWEVAFDGNYVFINKELADYNELSLNNKIKLEDEEGNTYEFEIIGIFEDNEELEDSMMSMFSNSANTILTNANTLVNIDNSNDSIKGSINPTFIIDDYENAETIQNDFYEKGLDETYVVQTNQETAEAGVTSVKNVKSFATTFLIITLLIGGVVLFILNMINIRERKYEIGVFRTIGISKLKLTMQFASELLVVAFVALIIGAGIGATMSKPVSNSLLSSEIESATNNSEQMKNNFGGMENMPGGRGDKPEGNAPDFNKMSGVPSIQAYDSIDAVVNVTVILELLVIGLSLVFVSSLASMISIQRFSPLTILKERS
ncbi:MAG: ABC transporter permease [Firmicutes bacterium]|nr:ABC transporter permease [Bacillota bacterium]